MFIKSITAATALLAAVASAAPASDLEARQGCTEIRNPERWEDGNPQQDAYWVQISDNLNCGGSCNIETSQTTSTTISFGAGGSADSWISANFGVSRTRSTGQSQGCEDSDHDRVCMWYEMHHTTYEVRDNVAKCNPSTGFHRPFDWDGDVYEMWSPNENNRGGFHCKYDDDCDHEGADYWVTNVASGGPP